MPSIYLGCNVLLQLLSCAANKPLETVDWLAGCPAAWLADWLAHLHRENKETKNEKKCILMCCRYNNFPLSNNNLNIKHANIIQQLLLLRVYRHSPISAVYVRGSSETLNQLMSKGVWEYSIAFFFLRFYCLSCTDFAFYFSLFLSILLSGYWLTLVGCFFFIILGIFCLAFCYYYLFSYFQLLMSKIFLQFLTASILFYL